MDIFIYSTFVSTNSEIKKHPKIINGSHHNALHRLFLAVPKKYPSVSNFWVSFNHNSKAGNILATIASLNHNVALDE